MKSVISYPYDVNQARAQLSSLSPQFATGAIRKERDQILPLLRNAPDLVMAASTFFNFSPSLYAHELDLAGDFAADFVVSDNRDSESTALLIECEGCESNAAFKKRKKSKNRAMGNKLFEGFGQIVDWLRCIEDLRRTSQLATTLKLPQTEAFNYHGLVLVGLDSDLGPDEQLRMGWLSSQLEIGRTRVHIMTYTTFFNRLAARLI
jgi:hypothetical protein